MLDLTKWIKGRFHPDPKPIEVPAGMRQPETLAQMMARMVDGRISQMAAERGLETVDDANDFDIDEDDVSVVDSRYQQMADEIEENESVREARERLSAAERRRKSGAESDGSGRRGERTREEDAGRDGDDRRSVRGSREMRRARDDAREDADESAAPRSGGSGEPR